MAEEKKSILDLDYSKYDFKDPEKFVYKIQRGLNRGVIEEISAIKNEPAWMREFRLASYEQFTKKPMPRWGADLKPINFDEYIYYMKTTDRAGKSWEEVPDYIKNTFDRLGIPEAERKFLAGVGAQYESEVVYHSIREDLAKKGVIFLDTDSALKEHPEIFREHFGTVVPPADNKFAALNSAVWSGGSFIYVPKGVKVEIPLQAYFRINAKAMGQFERTLIIADEGASVHYVEGCLPAGELISTGHNFVNIESIKPSDSIVAENGKYSRVRATMVRPYKGTMLTIIPQSKGNAFRLTPEHPVLSVKRSSVIVKRKKRNNWLPEVDTGKLLNTEPRYIPAEQLEVGDFIVYVSPLPSNDSPELSDEHLKLLGIYLAEGSASYNKRLKMNILTFSFGKTKKEKELAEGVLKIIEKLGEKGYLIKTSKGYYMVSSYSKKLIELCVKHCGKGASDKVFSETIMQLPPERQKILFDYYMKGDGNIYVKKPYYSKMLRVSTASRKLAYQIQEILARNGIFANISIRKGGNDLVHSRNITRKDQFIVQFSENSKFNQVRKRGNIFFVPIKEIKREYFDGFVFNLDVNSPESYLVKGFAVHNCTAPIYSKDSLHSAVVEVIAKKGAKVRYTTIQNWSKNVYNLVTKRAVAYENATVEWIDGNLGSKVTMKYPCVYLLGRGAKAEILSVAYAGREQHQDAGAKVIHVAPETTSTITSKSISKNGGRATYRGLLKVHKGATNVKSNVRCDALLLDEYSRSDTYPTMEIEEELISIGHEATVGKISEDQIFYLMSRGLSEAEALTAIVLGFIEPFSKELPMEYAIELNRLIQLEMEGAVG
jgi:Fe-S cluster assembly protein SufB